MKTKKAVSILTVIALVAAMTACAADDTAKQSAVDTSSEIEENPESALLLSAMAQAVPSHSSTSGKEETVYVLMNADGDDSKVIVSDQLKNADGAKALSDSTELQDIVNVNGYGSYQENADGTITWDTQGSDVFYRGTTDKELPVDVRISYELDGRKVNADEIAGKSGHVKIRLDYDNNSMETVSVEGKDYEVCVPFAVVSGMILPDENFTNVTAVNGRVIGEGNNEIVVGLAYPGLKESLDWDSATAKIEDENAREKLEEINIPDYVEIEADTTDFELGMTMSLAGCDLFHQLDAGDGIDLSDVTEKADELKDGVTKLSNGVKELKNGSGSLSEGAGALSDGALRLKDGAGTLHDGTASLYDGTLSLKNGTDTLYDGTLSLKNGTGELLSGTAALKDGAGKLSEGTGTLYKGILDYTDGADSVYNGTVQLKDGIAKVKDGSKKLRSGFEDNDIAGNAKRLAEGAGQLEEGLTTLQSELTGSLSENVTSMQQASELLSGTAEWMSTVLSAIDAYGAVPEANLQIPAAIAENSETLSALTGYSAEDCRSALAAYNSAHYALVSSVSEEPAADGAEEADPSDSSEASVRELLNADLDAHTILGSLELTSYAAAPETEEVRTLVRDGASEGKEDEDSEDRKTSDEEAKDDRGEDGKEDSDEEKDAGDEDVPDDELNPDDPESQADEDADEPDEEEKKTSKNEDEESTEEEETVLSEEETEEETESTEDAGHSRSSRQEKTVVVKEIRCYGMSSSDLSKAGDAAQKCSRCEELIGIFEGSAKVYASVAGSMGTLGQQAGSGIATLLSGAGTLKEGMMSLSGGLSDIGSGIASLDDGIGTVSEGAGKLTNGAGTLVSNNGTLRNGAAELRDGAGALSDGALALTDGAQRLNAGAGELSDGAGKLSTGAGELLDGAGRINSGTGELLTGITTLSDGAVSLSEGAVRLDDGIGELLGGMMKFDEEGLQELSKLLDEDAEDVLNRFHAIRKAGEEYTSFTGALDGNGTDSENSVRFVFKTGAVSG